MKFFPAIYAAAMTGITGALIFGGSLVACLVGLAVVHRYTTGHTDAHLDG